MKRAVAVAVAVGVGLVASLALAWNVPKSAGDVMSTGGKMAVQTALNKKIESSNCAFKGGTADTTCNIDKLGRELAAAYKGAKEAANYSVYINIEADDAPTAGKGKKATAGMPGSMRADKVSDKLRGSLAAAALTESWHYNTRSTNSQGNGLKISVEVK